MELPRKYPYNPSLALLVAGVVPVVALLLMFIHTAQHPRVGLYLVPALVGWAGAVIFYWEMAGVALAVLVLQWMRISQRMKEERFLKLREEEMVLPYGMWKVADLALPYAEMERVWQGKLFEKPVLYVVVKGKTYAIRPARLPDMASYTEIREFLYSKVKQRRAPGGPGIG